MSRLSGRGAGEVLDRIYRIFHDYHVNPVNPVKCLITTTTQLEIRRDRSPETSSDLHDIVRC